MLYSTAFVLAAAGLAAAQSTTTTAAAGTSSSSTSQSGCGSQVDTIIQTCLGTENAQLQACAANDWKCLCTQSTNVLTCYNNCPTDSNAFGAQQTQTSYCNAAKAYSSSDSSSLTATASFSSGFSSTLASQSASLSATTASTASATGDSSSSSTGSSSASAASSTSSAFAGSVVLPASGVLTALLGFAALF